MPSVSAFKAAQSAASSSDSLSRSAGDCVLAEDPMCVRVYASHVVVWDCFWLPSLSFL